MLRAFTTLSNKNLLVIDPLLVDVKTRLRPAASIRFSQNVSVSVSSGLGRAHNRGMQMNTSTTLPTMHPLAAIAKHTGVNTRTLKTQIKIGRLRAVRIGRTFFVPDEAAREFLAAR